MIFVQNFRVVELTTASEHAVIRELRTKYGFPPSGDVWLVRTALSDARSGAFGSSIILSEDCDLYDPPFKNDAAYRAKLIGGRVEGKLAKYLRKRHDIVVASVSQLLAV